MIIITGPGRSGTSLVAALYAELGYDPGGQWSDEISAGYEDLDVVRLNHRIASDLGVTVVGYHLPARMFQLATRVKPFVGPSVRRRLWRSWGRLPGVKSRGVGMIDWMRLDTVVRGRGEEMRAIATERVVVKDPVFSWVLPAWTRAEAKIDHVVVCTRCMDDIVRSRNSAGLSHFHDGDAMRNSVMYGLGVCLSAVADSGLPLTVIRYPESFRQPEELYRQLPFPEPVPYSAFAAALGAVVRPDLLNASRTEGGGAE